MELEIATTLDIVTELNRRRIDYMLWADDPKLIDRAFGGLALAPHIPRKRAAIMAEYIRRYLMRADCETD